MRILFVILFFFGLGSSACVHAQSEILLMSGKTIDGTVTSLDSAYVYYNLQKRNGKEEPKKLDLERVFSYTDQDGTESVVYLMDTTIGNYFSEDEMRKYIWGEQDAINYYRGNWTMTVGLPLTAGVGYVASGSILVFAVPFAYLVGTSFPKYKIDSKRVAHPEMITEPAYILGFERAAKNKRLFKSLVAGLVGTAIGVAVGQSIND